jgi:hypothetical protein
MKEAPFKATIAGGTNFGKDIKTFGLDAPLPPVLMISLIGRGNLIRNQTSTS